MYAPSEVAALAAMACATPLRAGLPNTISKIAAQKMDAPVCSAKPVQVLIAFLPASRGGALSQAMWLTAFTGALAWRECLCPPIIAAAIDVRAPVQPVMKVLVRIDRKFMAVVSVGKTRGRWSGTQLIFP